MDENTVTSLHKFFALQSVVIKIKAARRRQPTFTPMIVETDSGKRGYEKIGDGTGHTESEIASEANDW